MENKEKNEKKQEDIEEIEAEIVDDDSIDKEVKEDISSKEEKVKKDEKDEFKDKYQRLLADFTNYKNREEKAKKEFKRFASTSLIENLLPVLDNFDRALKDKDEDDPFVKGMIMTRDEMLKVLKQEGLTEIKSDGEKFDPKFHNAVMTEENDEFEEDYIIETFQKGYMIDNKVIRAAMVKVSK